MESVKIFDGVSYISLGIFQRRWSIVINIEQYRGFPYLDQHFQWILLDSQCSSIEMDLATLTNHFKPWIIDEETVLLLFIIIMKIEGMNVRKFLFST